MGDLSPAHMQARTVLRQLEIHLRTLFPPSPQVANGRPAMHLPRLPTFNPGERALVGAWKAYLKWEESNPLEIEDKDRPTFLTRMQGVYRKAVIRMRYFAEIWSVVMVTHSDIYLIDLDRYMAFVWTNSVGKTDEALGILRSGMEANPSRYVVLLRH
jgi:cleavage stimulation factor subunit 3